MSFITDGTTIKNIEHYFTKYKLPISITDTIMAVDFYIAKNTTDLGQLGHQFALTHINKKTNTLLLHKVDYDKYVKLTFKIYKWTKSEIIIKDITPERPNRIYYLTRE